VYVHGKITTITKGVTKSYYSIISNNFPEMIRKMFDVPDLEVVAWIKVKPSSKTLPYVADSN
jgi:hypothetical protein